MMIAETAGRCDELCKIRGVLLTPVAVDELVRAEFPEIREYEVIVERRAALDEITLRVEPQEEMGDEALAKLSARLSERLKIKTNLGFNIHFALPGELPRYTLKSRRFKDKREA
jgi:phenylacetate-CoA ligase